jgi:DNA-binding NtrC family response regulator
VLQEGGRVLVVEDNDDTRNVLVDALITFGYRAIAADSYAAAVDIVEQHPVDVVLSDVLLGGPDGFALWQYVTRARPTLPFIVMTADPHSFKRATAEGLPVLKKPFGIWDMCTALDRISRRSTSATAARLPSG